MKKMFELLFSIFAIGLGFYEFKRVKKLIAVSKEQSQNHAPYAGFGWWQGYVFGGTLIFLGALGIIDFIVGIS